MEIQGVPKIGISSVVHSKHIDPDCIDAVSYTHLMAAFVIASYELAFQTFDTRLIIRRDRDFQQSFRFCTADSQQTVGGAAFQRLGEVEVIPVFGSFIDVYKRQVPVQRLKHSKLSVMGQLPKTLASTSVILQEKCMT